MKERYIHTNLLILFSILFFIKSISTLDFTYPSAISLNNGNIFVIEKEGICIYDEQLVNIVYNYPFEEGEKIEDLNNLSNIIIKYEYNYIICLINLKIYFFKNDGEKLLETGKLIIDEDFSYPTLSPIELNDNDYFYTISYYLYKNDVYQLKIKYYKISITSTECINEFISEKIMEKFTSSFWGNNRLFQNMGLSCVYMQSESNTNDNYLTCFFIIKVKNSLTLAHYFFELSETPITESYDYYYDYIDDLDDISDIKQIKAVINNNRKKALVCLLFTNRNLRCYKFRYSTGFLTNNAKFYQSLNTEFDCRNELYGMKLDNLIAPNNIVLSCVDEKALVQAIFFDDELDSKGTINKFEECKTIYGHSVLYSTHHSDYYVISDVICDNNKRCFEPINGELTPIQEVDIIKKSNDFLEQKENEKEKEKETEKGKETENEKEKEKEKGDEKEEEKENEKEKKEDENEREKEREMKENENKKEKENNENEKNFDCSDLEKCSQCDKDSYAGNLCTECNQENNYYYLNKYPSEPKSKYINCVNEATKPSKFYFNEDNLDYEPCFITCASCESGGNYIENKCTSCDGINYIKDPIDENSSNCVVKCKFLYYIEHGIYKCTESQFCPKEYSYLIKEKSQCTNNCLDDNKYQYRYNGECFIECPENTEDDDDFICKDKEINKCILTENEYDLISEDILYEELEQLVEEYIKEFDYTNNHVSVYKNNDYTITIYIEKKCILDLNLGIPEFDFGSCYQKVKTENSLVDDDEVIIVIIDKKNVPKNNREILKYGMFSPVTGEYLNSDEICEEEKITSVTKIEDKISEAGIKIDSIRELVNDGVDIFNMSSPFYNDICFQYHSKKDIALKDRVLEFFPNITLCENGCEMKGINMTTVTAICECFYSNSKREENLKNKFMEQAQISFIEDMISSSNIYVVKCIHLLSKISNLKKCYGGFFVFILIIIEVICTIIYCTNNIYSINKYIFSITNKYLNYLFQKNQNKKNSIQIENNLFINEDTNKHNAPPKLESKKSVDNSNSNNQHKLINKVKKKRKTAINGNISLMKTKNNYDLNKMNNIYLNNNNLIRTEKKGRNILIFKPKNSIDLSNLSDKNLFSEQKHEISTSRKNLFFDFNDNLNININEYIKTQYEDMDYDEAIRKDHRKFCTSYCDKLKNDQIIINTFVSNDPIRPRTIKIIFLILQLVLYLFINGLSYDEEYISKIYHLKKDTFLTIAERFVDNLIYAALAGIIINYIIEFFFIEEKKIRKILKIEKNDFMMLKFEMIKILKSIKKRYLIFIIISFIISFIALIHIFCFNVVYKHTMNEWIIFSVIIIISIQIGSFLICLFQTIIRYISFKCKSERLFKLSI